MPFTRRQFIQSSVTAGVALAAGCLHQSSSRSATDRPNIILILTDDQGYGELGCHGNPIIRTPYLDAFYRQSARFTDFHVSPTCAPTRCSIMTGRHEFRSGVTHTIYERERMSLKPTILPQFLKSAGYSTGIFGKWHLGDEAPYQPDQRGFDEVFIHGGGGIGQTYPGSCGDAPGNTYFNPAILHNRLFVKTQGFCTDVFFAQAISWIDQRRKSNRPFFAYIATNAPHDPFVCPEEYSRPYRAAGLDEKSAAYYGMITNIDENVGRLLTRLREWSLEANTLIIFMTDNGHSIGTLYNAGMRGAKGTPYQGGTRVPAFFRLPGVTPPDTDLPNLAAHVDLLPTLMELAGGRVPADVKLDGRSLLPLFANAGAVWPDRYLFTHLGRWPKGRVAEYKHKNCAVRNARFRLVNDKELHDIQDDPGETRNVINEHPAVVAKMRRAYDRWWDEILPCLENESAVGPKVNPFKAMYWKQFGGEPDEAMRKRMDPSQLVP